MGATPGILKQIKLPSFSNLAIGFRAALFAVLAIIANRALGIETSELALALSGCMGVLAAKFLVDSRFSFRGLIVLLCALVVTLKGSFWLLEHSISDAIPQFFFIDVVERHAGVVLTSLIVSLLFTWFLLRVPGFLTIELVAFLTLFIWVFSAHRNFRFDYPKFLNSIAWDLGVSQVTALVFAGVMGVLFIGTYLLALRSSAPTTQSTIGRRRSWFPRLVAAAIAVAVLYLISVAVQRNFTRIEIERATNGVGSEHSAGLSPLGFHSALGSTNQPSAVVRLDNDYPQNPTSPMLYMRENALSQYNGHELVIAPRTYDQDISGNSPDEHYVGDEERGLGTRVKVAFSAYLLTEHDLSFAIDYPISISPLKNPNPQRFKKAFRAVSMAPTYKVEDLEFLELGDSAWTKEVWDHYLQPNTDSRYAQIAEKISLSAMTPIMKAKAVVDFLNANAIYTLTPNHAISKDSDPVAPFLFGDLRGYCVHFAHAMVYMFRTLGIPARIGTGYLTDLSQAKDGHILLRMSDRHAWAEVYIRGKGWVPFDVKPQQVESHAETQVDMKLLEELMGLLGPDETILPKDLDKLEPLQPTKSKTFQIPLSLVLLGLSGFIFCIYLAKFFVRFGWLFTSDPSGRLKHLFFATQSWYHDLGFKRTSGETRLEFRDRLSGELGMECMELTGDFSSLKYGSNKPSNPQIGEILKKANIEKAQLMKRVGILKRVIGILSPLSVFEYVRGGR